MAIGPNPPPPQWTAGVVKDVGTGLAINSGTINATGTAVSEWQAGTVNAVGTGLTIAAGGTIAAIGGVDEWNAGTVNAIGTNLSITSGTLNATGGGGTQEWQGGLVTTVGQGLTIAVPGGATAPTVDGFATGAAGAHQSVIQAVLTTTGTDDIVCALIACEEFTTLPTVTAVSGAGLTWTRQAQSTNTNPAINQIDLELWYADAPLALTSETIIATFSGTFDAASMVAFGVAGANTTTPWDTASNLPQTPTGSENPGDMHFADISTFGGADFLIYGAATANSGQLPGTIPTGTTVIATATSTGSNAGSFVCAAFESATVQQSGTNTWPLGVFCAGLYDALISSGQATTGTIEVSGPLGTVIAIGAGLTITAGTLHT